MAENFLILVIFVSVTLVHCSFEKENSFIKVNSSSKLLSTMGTGPDLRVKIIEARDLLRPRYLDKIPVIESGESGGSDTTEGKTEFPLENSITDQPILSPSGQEGDNSAENPEEESPIIPIITGRSNDNGKIIKSIPDASNQTRMAIDKRTVSNGSNVRKLVNRIKLRMKENRQNETSTKKMDSKTKAKILSLITKRIKPDVVTDKTNRSLTDDEKVSLEKKTSETPKKDENDAVSNHKVDELKEKLRRHFKQTTTNSSLGDKRDSKIRVNAKITEAVKKMLIRKNKLAKEKEIKRTLDVTPIEEGTRKVKSPVHVKTDKRKNIRSRLRDRLRSLNIFSKGTVQPHLPDSNTVSRSGLIPETLKGPAQDIITDFVFSAIKCANKRGAQFFETTIHIKKHEFHTPYIRDRPEDSLKSQTCNLVRVPGEVESYRISLTDFGSCGVKRCGDNGLISQNVQPDNSDDALCLTLVFPRVPTLALADDEVTTIRCMPQKKIMSDTRTISFAGDSLNDRRSSSTVQGGLQEFEAEVGVFRQTPGTSNGLFVKRVHSGGIVQLGEPLQLRSVVRDGDGWMSSKLSDVKVWHMRSGYTHRNLDQLDPNEASEVITLVDTNGCRNEEYKLIADDMPIRDPRNPLVHHFTFKAFLFRGQRSNEPLIVTARVHACQTSSDCNFSGCQLQDGIRSIIPGALQRQKRSPHPTELHNISSIIHEFEPRMAIRVVGFGDSNETIDKAGESQSLFDSDLYEISDELMEDEIVSGCAVKLALAGSFGAVVSTLLFSMIFALFRFYRASLLESAFGDPNNSHQKDSSFQIVQFKRHGKQNEPLPEVPNKSKNDRMEFQSDKKTKVIENISKLIENLNETDYGNGSRVYEQMDGGNKMFDIDKKNNGKSNGKDVYIVYANSSKKEKNEPDETTDDVDTGGSSSEYSPYNRRRHGPRALKTRRRGAINAVKRLKGGGSYPCRRQDPINRLPRKHHSLSVREASKSQMNKNRSCDCCKISRHHYKSECEYTSDMDSAYYGSSIYNEGKIETEKWAHMHHNEFKLPPATTMGHIVSKNNEKTQILIVPETRL